MSHPEQPKSVDPLLRGTWVVIAFLITVAIVLNTHSGWNSPRHGQTSSFSVEQAERSEAPGVQPLSTEPASHQRELRLMFVGDSITEGIAGGGSARHRLPQNGSCSFRFELLKRLSTYAQQQHPPFRLRTVGPLTHVVGADSPPTPCCNGVLMEMPVSVGDSPNQSDAASQHRRCFDTFGRHAAIWGGVSADFLRSTPESLRSKRLQLLGGYFGRRAAKFLINKNMLLFAHAGIVNHSKSLLWNWVSHSQPEILIMALGTNDLYNEGSSMLAALTVFRNSTTAMLREVMDAASVSLKSIGVSTLLGRNEFDVSHYNDILLSVKKCQQASRVLRACALCVQKALVEASGTKQMVLENDILSVWCHPQLRILHGGSAWLSTKQENDRFLYDGLHPNGEGESRIAEKLLTEIIESRLLVDSGVGLD